MNDTGFDRILQKVTDKLNPNATLTSGLLNTKNQVIFAVRPGLDGKLDAMRNVYNTLVDQTEGERVYNYLCVGCVGLREKVLCAIAMAENG